MTKNDILAESEAIITSCIHANSYLDILRQFEKNAATRIELLNISPAFYKSTFRALREAIILAIARLYDDDSDTISIRNILKKYAAAVENQIIPEYDMMEWSQYSRVDNQKYTKKLLPQEECFFRQQVEEARDFYRKVNEDWGMDDSGNTPVTVELTATEYLDYFNKRLHSLNKKIKNLRELRNNIYAHTNKDTYLDLNTFFSNYPLNFDDIEELVVFAGEVANFAAYSLEGHQTLLRVTNIEDWNSTLSLVEIGCRYRHEDFMRRHSLS